MKSSISRACRYIYDTLIPSPTAALTVVPTAPPLTLSVLFQSGLPAMNVEILNQFPSPPVPNLPALAMAMATVMSQHQQPLLTHPPVSMAVPTPAPPVMPMTPAVPVPAPANSNFLSSFPPSQVALIYRSYVFSGPSMVADISLTRRRGPRPTTMISRTSRRLQRREQSTRPLPSSAARQVQVSPPV